MSSDFPADPQPALRAGSGPPGTRRQQPHGMGGDSLEFGPGKAIPGLKGETFKQGIERAGQGGNIGIGRNLTAFHGLSE